MRTKSLERAAGLALAALLFSACASGPSTASRRNVNLLIATHNWTAADDYLAKHKESEYGKKNMVLFYLDQGTVLHHAGRYTDSDQAFGQAETRMEELYTKSITKTGGMLLLNDNTVDYAGEPFERALTNVFRALNYVFLGKLEEAVVESRKVELFLDGLNRSVGSTPIYKDDAFARYLDSLLYADLGQTDDARISLEAAKTAYGWYATDYQTSAPSFNAAPQRGEGELVFIHYNGVAPRKVSKTVQVAWGNALAIAKQDTEASSGNVQNALRAGIAGHSITVAHPDYVQDPFIIAGSQVMVDGQPGPKTIVVEPISAIAIKTLRDRIGLIQARAIARATIKYILAESAAKVAAAACDRQFSGIAATLCKAGTRGVAHGVAAGTEVADTRGWSALPSEIRMARLPLAQGKHDVRVDFTNAQGQVIDSASFAAVQVSASKRTYLAYRTAK